MDLFQQTLTVNNFIEAIAVKDGAEPSRVCRLSYNGTMALNF